MGVVGVPYVWKSGVLFSRYAARSSPCETSMIFRNVEHEQNNIYLLQLNRYEYFLFLSFIWTYIKLPCILDDTSDNLFILKIQFYVLFLQGEWLNHISIDNYKYLSCCVWNVISIFYQQETEIIVQKERELNVILFHSYIDEILL
jgi:hypothetical protein